VAPRAVREYNAVMSPVGLGTKNNCAGEVQQQFSSLLVGGRSERVWKAPRTVRG
jgi:hypothetical protein